MLHSVGELLDSHVLASDGAVGRVIDAFFDERNWEIRYLLIQMGDSDAEQAVVCSAETVTKIDREASRVLVRQVPQPDPFMLQQVAPLRSSRSVLGCPVAGWTGALGRAEDAIFEVESWTLRFLMVNMSSCPPGGVAFIQPDLIDTASWDERSLRIAVTHVEVFREPDIELDVEQDALPVPSRARRDLH